MSTTEFDIDSMPYSLKFLEIIFLIFIEIQYWAFLNVTCQSIAFLLDFRNKLIVHEFIGILFRLDGIFIEFFLNEVVIFSVTDNLNMSKFALNILSNMINFFESIVWNTLKSFVILTELMPN